MNVEHKKRKLGLAFKDELLKTTAKSGHFKKQKLDDSEWEELLLPNYKSDQFSQPVSTWKAVFLAGIFLIFFFGLFLRLFHLQVILGKENRDKADFNRVQIRVIHAPRGVIYDRNNKVLAENNPGFRLKDKFISRDDALSMEAKNDPNFEALEIDTLRFYPFGQAFSHVLGYVGQISEEELKDSKFSGYRLGDRIGRSGLEQMYEQYLKGNDGAEIIEIDASGKKLRTLEKVDPIPGKNIYLSIDADFQKSVFEALKEGILKVDSCCGAAVAENPKTGEILALVSFPSFDANIFTTPGKDKDMGKIFSDPSAPLLNRVIGGVYPPGSTFKIASALAGLQSGKINKNTEFEDTGVMSLGPYKFANWFFTQHGKTEGAVNITKALQRSNDIFFYKVGDLVGEKILGEVAKKIGFGKKLGIDLPGEVDGLIPTAEWKQKNIGEVWYPGDNLHMAIGQGFLLTTPLQILSQTSFVANDGKLIKPHIVSKITTPDNRIVKQFYFDPIVQGIFKKEDLDLVKRGLALVPKDGGTAWPFFNFTIPTAGKTGTAEFGDPKDRTHAWYTAYAPLDDPSAVVTVLVETGGEGSSVAAPIAKQIYTWYFNPDKSKIKSLDNYPVASDSAKSLGE